jgi:hypothetical protein
MSATEVELFVYCATILTIIIIIGYYLIYLIINGRNVNRVYPAQGLNAVINIHEDLLRVERIIDIHFGFENNDAPIINNVNNINNRDINHRRVYDTESETTYDEPALDDKNIYLNIV